MWEDGELVAEPTDVTAHWREDLVAFLIGCSFTFEWALTDAGVPLRHVEQGRNVPMYVTERQCRPAGRLRGPDGGVHAADAAPAWWPRRVALIRTYARGARRLPCTAAIPGPAGSATSTPPDFGDPVEFARRATSRCSGPAG